MSDGFWNVRSDFLAVSPTQVIEQFWEDDELNRKRSLATFEDELALVDEGLALYMEPIQAAYRMKERWKDDIQMRASIAMLVHALNAFLAKRHLLTHGYLAEALLLTRSIHESLSQALVFSIDEALAKRFYANQTIAPKKIRGRLSKGLADEETPASEIYKQFRDLYGHLSNGAHPTLGSFSMRTAAQKLGPAGLSEAVPEDVVMGGLLEVDLGRVVWLGLAQNIVYGLSSIRQLVKENTGEWEKQYEVYRSKVENLVNQQSG